MFGHGWERAEATMVEAEFVPIHKGDRHKHNVYVVEVRPAGQARFVRSWRSRRRGSSRSPSGVR